MKLRSNLTCLRKCSRFLSEDYDIRFKYLYISAVSASAGTVFYDAFTFYKLKYIFVHRQNYENVILKSKLQPNFFPLLLIFNFSPLKTSQIIV